MTKKSIVQLALPLSSAHTPSPWKVRVNAFTVQGTFIVAEDGIIADVRGWSERGIKLPCARNACLFAAAPDLLAASKLAQMALMYLQTQGDIAPGGELALELLDAALKKAVTP